MKWYDVGDLLQKTMHGVEVDGRIYWPWVDNIKAGWWVHKLIKNTLKFLQVDKEKGNLSEK